jgi:hypothetical protein
MGTRGSIPGTNTKFYCMPKCPTCSEAHPASISMPKRAITLVVKRLGREAELRISGVIPPLPLYSFTACTETSLLSYCHFLQTSCSQFPTANQAGTNYRILNARFNILVLVVSAGFLTDLGRLDICRKLFPSLIIKPSANFNLPFLYKFTL